MDQQLSKRLKSKSVKNAIINQIAKDFNLTPLLAEAYFKQISSYFLEYTDPKLQPGQLQYLAIDDREPAGKPIDLCQKVSVNLSIHKPDEDLEVYKNSGLAGLRRHKLMRISKEAIEQGALLSYEDIAFLCTSSIITIKRDMAQMRREGRTIPTRGWRHDMGRGTTHKSQILGLYFKGYQFSEIEQRTHHSETAVQRYIQDFNRIILLHHKDFSVDEIRVSTGFSNRLIGEYIQLFETYNKKDNIRMAACISPIKKNTGKN